VLDEVAQVSGIKKAPLVVDRRPGDPARVIASVDRIKAELGWDARHDLPEIVSSAWTAWQSRTA
jgi:UDP-glucose 4-epimerase